MTDRKQDKRAPGQAVLSTGADAPMTAEQAALLRALSRDAYEADAFSAALTRAQAELRIATLKAKLKLMGEPPHTQ